MFYDESRYPHGGIVEVPPGTLHGGIVEVPPGTLHVK